MSIKQRIAMKAFIVYEGKVLVVREGTTYNDAHHVGKGYGLVGGRIDPGENHKTALYREVREEVGKEDISIGRAFSTSEWHIDRGEEVRQIVATFFVVHADTDRVVLGQDHDMYLWIEPSTYKEVGVYENIWPVFEEYMSL